jgi:seryl-tRNA synthetase
MYGVFDMLMKKIMADGFIPMYVPVLTKERALYGSSQFPADMDQIYKIDNAYVEEGQSLYLIGSSEPSLFAYYADTCVKREELPIKMFALTPCFRSEAGSWGKDVRGIKRVHQFDKLEMDIVALPDLKAAIELHEYMLGINEWLLQTLELPYHVINMCTGDLGYAAAAKKYDVEVWLPGDKVFMETMSDSMTTDYQARRMNIKCNDKYSFGGRELVYTLNDTGATHRLLIALIEHYQQADGSIKVPAALKSYINKDFIK